MLTFNTFVPLPATASSSSYYSAYAYNTFISANSTSVTQNTISTASTVYISLYRSTTIAFSGVSSSGQSTYKTDASGWTYGGNQYVSNTGNVYTTPGRDISTSIQSTAEGGTLTSQGDSNSYRIQATATSATTALYLDTDAADNNQFTSSIVGSLSIAYLTSASFTATTGGTFTVGTTSSFSNYTTKYNGTGTTISSSSVSLTDNNGGSGTVHTNPFVIPITTTSTRTLNWRGNSTTQTTLTLNQWTSTLLTFSASSASQSFPYLVGTSFEPTGYGGYASSFVGTVGFGGIVTLPVTVIGKAFSTETVTSVNGLSVASASTALLSYLSTTFVTSATGNRVAACTIPSSSTTQAFSLATTYTTTYLGTTSSFLTTTVQPTASGSNGTTTFKYTTTSGYHTYSNPSLVLFTGNWTTGVGGGSYVAGPLGSFRPGESLLSATLFEEAYYLTSQVGGGWLTYGNEIGYTFSTSPTYTSNFGFGKVGDLGFTVSIYSTTPVLAAVTINTYDASASTSAKVVVAGGQTLTLTNLRSQGTYSTTRLQSYGSIPFPNSTISTTNTFKNTSVVSSTFIVGVATSGTSLNSGPVSGSFGSSFSDVVAFSSSLLGNTTANGTLTFTATENGIGSITLQTSTAGVVLVNATQSTLSLSGTKGNLVIGLVTGTSSGSTVSQQASITTTLVPELYGVAYTATNYTTNSAGSVGFPFDAWTPVLNQGFQLASAFNQSNPIYTSVDFTSPAPSTTLFQEVLTTIGTQVSTTYQSVSVSTSAGFTTSLFSAGNLTIFGSVFSTYSSGSGPLTFSSDNVFSNLVTVFSTGANAITANLQNSAIWQVFTLTDASFSQNSLTLGTTDWRIWKSLDSNQNPYGYTYDTVSQTFNQTFVAPPVRALSFSTEYHLALTLGASQSTSITALLANSPHPMSVFGGIPSVTQGNINSYFRFTANAIQPLPFYLTNYKSSQVQTTYSLARTTSQLGQTTSITASFSSTLLSYVSNDGIAGGQTYTSIQVFFPTLSDSSYYFLFSTGTDQLLALDIITLVSIVHSSKVGGSAVPWLNSYTTVQKYQYDAQDTPAIEFI